MEEVKKVELLLRNADEIRDLFTNKLPRWSANRDKYDKVRVGFGEGSSNGWYQSCETNVWFFAWMCTYGYSSTYKQINLDGDLFKKHFVSYLNKNKESIMMAIADQITEEARSIKEKATKELTEKLNSLEKI
jgi:hypothetical protein